VGPTIHLSVNSVVGLVVFALLVALNGVFVAGEFALVAVDSGRIASRADAGSRRAKLVQRLLARRTFQLAGTQVGVTVTSILLGFLAEPLLAKLLKGPFAGRFSERTAETIAVVLALFIATAVQLIAAELVPKNIAAAKAEDTSMLLAPILRVYSLVFSPLIKLLNGSAEWVANRLGFESGLDDEHGSVADLDELDLFIRSSGELGTLDPAATQLLTRTIRFGDKTVAEVVVPRVDIIGLPDTATAADLAHAVAEHGFSRFPVYEGDLDHIVGVVLTKDLLALDEEVRATTPVTALMSPIFAVPEAKSLRSMLVAMRVQKRQLAVVIDEYGGTAGIATLEDVLEEIVGEIDDEYDEPSLTSIEVDNARLPGHGTFDGDTGTDRFRELTGIELPDGDYETVAGFLLVIMDRIPSAGDHIEWEGWRFDIRDMERLRIASFDVRPLRLHGEVDGHDGASEVTS
jgi:CBS domain containing-hemolysin-like protein